jgi:predicted nuclease of predicted toxin-antitoxin system
VARFYSNENIALQLVMELRRLGHDVLTSLDAGNANSAVPDSEVLAFATAEGRTLLSHNRRDFLRLHSGRTASHAGIVLCTFDPDFASLAIRIHAAVATQSNISDQVIRGEPAWLTVMANRILSDSRSGF